MCEKEIVPGEDKQTNFPKEQLYTEVYSEFISIIYQKISHANSSMQMISALVLGQTFIEVENVLNEDVVKIAQFLTTGRLQSSETKTVSSVFHLYNA